MFMHKYNRMTKTTADEMLPPSSLNHLEARSHQEDRKLNDVQIYVIYWLVKTCDLPYFLHCRIFLGMIDCLFSSLCDINRNESIHKELWIIRNIVVSLFFIKYLTEPYSAKIHTVLLFIIILKKYFFFCTRSLFWGHKALSLAEEQQLCLS